MWRTFSSTHTHSTLGDFVISLRFFADDVLNSVMLRGLTTKSNVQNSLVDISSETYIVMLSLGVPWSLSVALLLVCEYTERATEFFRRYFCYVPVVYKLRELRWYLLYSLTELNTMKQNCTNWVQQQCGRLIIRVVEYRKIKYARFDAEMTVENFIESSLSLGRSTHEPNWTLTMPMNWQELWYCNLRPTLAVGRRNLWVGSLLSGQISTL